MTGSARTACGLSYRPSLQPIASWKVWTSAQTEFTLAFETTLPKAGSVELSGRWKDTSQVGGWTGTPRVTLFPWPSIELLVRSLTSTGQNVDHLHGWHEV